MTSLTSGRVSRSAAGELAEARQPEREVRPPPFHVELRRRQAPRAP